MPKFLVQSYLVKTRLEQAAYSKEPRKPFLPLYTPKSSYPLFCHIWTRNEKQ